MSSSRAEGTNPRATGTNPRGPRQLSREEREEADHAARRRADERTWAENDAREDEIRATPKTPMPPELRDMLRDPPAREQAS